MRFVRPESRALKVTAIMATAALGAMISAGVIGVAEWAVVDSLLAVAIVIGGAANAVFAYLMSPPALVRAVLDSWVLAIIPDSRLTRFVAAQVVTVAVSGVWAVLLLIAFAPHKP
jgi:hypothetical protein